MTTAVPQLPKNRRALARVIQQHVDREVSKQAYPRMMWKICHAYLSGARKFKIMSSTGELIQHWHLDKEGNLMYQAQDLLSIIDRLSAKLSTMDLWPSVIRNDRSIQSLRQRATAQVIADAIVSEDRLQIVSRQFAHIFTALGCCGLYADLSDHPTAGLTLDIEVVHPAEIFPFPSLGWDFTKQRGLVRRRIVPLSFLKDRLGRSLPRSVIDNDITAWRQRPTDTLERSDGADSTSTGAMTASASGGPREADLEEVTVVEINEVWVFGVRDTVSRYIVTSGDHVFVDSDFEAEGREVYCPLSFSTFMDTGSFYGAGAFSLLYGLIRHYERLMESLFTNVRDLDRYGFVVMPAGSWDQNTALRDVGRGLRVLPYDPDVAADSFRPFVVQPYNAGDLPGKTAAFARTALRDINPLRDLADEKGRIDSAAGLQYLDEELNRALTNPTSGIQRAFGSVYRAGVAAAASALSTAPRSLPISRLDLNLVGAVIDETGDRVSFTTNPLPRVGSLRFTVREVAPRSSAVRKAEALELLKLQQMVTGAGDWDSFVVWAVREGIELAMDTGTIRAAVQTATVNILRLFNDGQTPGRIIDSPYLAEPAVQRRLLREFMAGPELRAASVEVQDAFIQYDLFLAEQSSVVLPEGVPSLEDTIALSVQAQQQQPAMRLTA